MNWNSLLLNTTETHIRRLAEILQVQLPTGKIDVRLRTEILHAAALSPGTLGKIGLALKGEAPHPPRLLPISTSPLKAAGATCRGACVSAESYGLHPFTTCGAPISAGELLCAPCRSNTDPTHAKVLRMASTEPLPILVHILREKDPVRRNIMMLRWRSGISGASPF